MTLYWSVCFEACIWYHYCHSLCVGKSFRLLSLLCAMISSHLLFSSLSLFLSLSHTHTHMHTHTHTHTHISCSSLTYSISAPLSTALNAFCSMQQHIDSHVYIHSKQQVMNLQWCKFDCPVPAISVHPSSHVTSWCCETVSQKAKHNVKKNIFIQIINCTTAPLLYRLPKCAHVHH